MIRLFIMMLVCGLSCSAGADTIDFWHVYHNHIKIKEYNQHSTGEIVLNTKHIKQTDTLSIAYFRDTPCHNCSTAVSIENENNVVVTTGKGLGTFHPLNIAVYDLLQHHLKEGNGVYQVYYQEEQPTGRPKRIHLFSIKLE